MNEHKLIGPFRQILTMDGLPHRGPLVDDQLQVIEQGGILISGDKIEALGSFNELQNRALTIEKMERAYTLIPGLIDAHTHICWAGSRAGDFAMRLAGKSYTEIAASGGGIWSTVMRTREASEANLSEITLNRANTLIENGITTLEVKSGYGLDADNEIKMLKAIMEADKQGPADLIPTCLAAHIRPHDFKGSPREYLQYILDAILPRVKKERLSSRVDIYIDKGAFSTEDAAFYLQKASQMGFDCIVHADQFVGGGLRIAVENGAVSADHLESTSTEEIAILARSSVIPVALPGASLGLGMPFAPARKLLNAGTSLVIASDWNPGSAPMGNLLSQAAILGVYEKLTLTETLAAITFRAAQALRLNDRGILSTGMLADFVAYPCSDYREILYYQGSMKPVKIWKRGKLSGQTGVHQP